MFGIRQSLADDLLENWEPANPKCFNQENGLLVFLYPRPFTNTNTSLVVIRTKIIAWMEKEGFVYGKDYTLNNSTIGQTAYKSAAAVWFKDPQSFVLMKMKYG